MNIQEKASRRRFIRDAGLLVGTMALTASRLAFSARGQLPDLVVASAKDSKTDPKALVRKAVEELGGMKRFVSRGDVVVVKPNMAWDRLPRQAANTNPLVVAALVEMALEAGAKKVKVFDNAVANPQAAYTRSGIAEAARKAGAEVKFLDERFFKEVEINGTFLKRWKVYTEALECDCLINVPIAKHHSIAGLTMGLKNHMGIIGGERSQWHRALHVALAEFAAFVKPKLVVLDAYRILVRHGPTGGSMRDVKMARKCIAGVDQVAVDAYGTSLFGKKPTDLGYLVKANQLGVGEIDLGKVRVREVVV